MHMMAHDGKDSRKDCEFAGDVIVHPANDKEYSAAADRQAHHHEQQCADDTLRQGPGVDRAMQGETEDDRNNDPANAVVDDGRRKDDLANDTAHKVHLAHDHRNDLHRCD